MEYIEAQRIKAEWGDKPCDHPYLVKEYYTGAFLTNYVCTQCGMEFTIPQKMEISLQRRKMKKDHSSGNAK